MTNSGEREAPDAYRVDSYVLVPFISVPFRSRVGAPRFALGLRPSYGQYVAVGMSDGLGWVFVPWNPWQPRSRSTAISNRPAT